MEQDQLADLARKIGDAQRMIKIKHERLLERERLMEDEKRSLHSRELALAAAMREYEGLKHG